MHCRGCEMNFIMNIPITAECCIHYSIQYYLSFGQGEKDETLITVYFVHPNRNWPCQVQKWVMSTDNHSSVYCCSRAWQQCLKDQFLQMDATHNWEAWPSLSVFYYSTHKNITSIHMNFMEFLWAEKHARTSLMSQSYVILNIYLIRRLKAKSHIIHVST